MDRPLARLVIGGAIMLGVLGSGPCPGCYNDECSPKGETGCRDNVAFYCAEPNEDGAYALQEEDCTATGSVCVVLDDDGEGAGPRATCVDEVCPDGGACGDASVCAGDACLPDAAMDLSAD